MLDLKELKAEMIRNGYNNSMLAQALGITTRTLSERFKTGDFGCKEIEIIIDILKLKEPMKIFFADKVT